MGTMRVEGPTWLRFVRTGVPSAMSEMSALVPPISRVITLERPQAFASAVPPMMPPIGPEWVSATGNSDALAKVEKPPRSEEHTSELQSLMRISYAVFCLKKTIKEQNDEL